MHGDGAVVVHACSTPSSRIIGCRGSVHPCPSGRRSGSTVHAVASWRALGVSAANAVVLAGSTCRTTLVRPVLGGRQLVDHRAVLASTSADRGLVLIGALIAFPLALLARRYRLAGRPGARAVDVLYTIPSLALFAFIAPFDASG